MDLTSIIREMLSVLRYFAAPMIGYLFALFLDGGLDSRTASISTDKPYLVIAFVIVMGILIYHVHRTLYPPIRRLLFYLGKKVKRCKSRESISDKEGVVDFAFAQWNRRASPEGSRLRSVQTSLDHQNAGVHFLYCSAYASLLIPLLITTTNCLGRCFPIAIAFFILGLIADWTATLWDLEAFIRLKNEKNEQRPESHDNQKGSTG